MRRRREGLKGRYRKARDTYILVFALLLLVIGLTAAIPGGGLGGSIGSLGVTALQSLALVLTLDTAGVTGRKLAIARGLAAVPVFAVLIAAVAGSAVGPAYYVSNVVLILGTQAAIVVHAVRRGTITLDTVMGALCIYLLLGLLFASVDGFFAHAVAPFFAQAGTHPGSDYIYFSFITLETVGYGDLTPGPAPARMLALSEGLLGQIYLVTVISVLVGNLGRQRPERSTGPDGGPEQEG